MHPDKIVSIVPVAREALGLLQQISTSTFLETFATSNTREDMDRYLEENMTEEKLLEEWSTVGSSFYFAYVDEALAGYLKTNTGAAQTELKEDNGLEIERIYVSGAYQGMQLGQQLMAKAQEAARAQNKSFVWLGVWEHNHKAIGFYRKNGFEIFDQHVFRLGNDEQTDVLMKLILT